MAEHDAIRHPKKSSLEEVGSTSTMQPPRSLLWAGHHGNQERRHGVASPGEEGQRNHLPSKQKKQLAPHLPLAATAGQE
jgi:hypothetical protein